MGNKQDEVLTNMCSATQGCFEINLDTNEPHGNCVYSKLIQAGYTSDSLCSAGEKDAHSINYLRNLVHPEHLSTGGGPLGKMHPECLSLVSIIQKCKLKISAIVSEISSGEREKKMLLVCLLPSENRRFRTNV